jgi:probable phosphomutase (TIGR03848 family)
LLEMTIFYLIRHGNTDYMDRILVGRRPDVHLNAHGRAQAERLADRLERIPIEAIYSSPLERARETAKPLSDRLGIEIGVLENLNEVDFGEWTGRDFQELAGDSRWRQFNLMRSCTRIPGGELVIEVQQRSVCELERLHTRHPHGSVAVVSHGDVLRAVIAYFAAIPFDLFLRIAIMPASISVVAINSHGPAVLRINDTGDL